MQIVHIDDTTVSIAKPEAKDLPFSISPNVYVTITP